MEIGGLRATHMKLLKISALVLAGFVIGVLASYVAYLALPGRITEPTIQVVVASRDIPTSKRLDCNDVHLEKVPVMRRKAYCVLFPTIRS